MLSVNSIKNVNNTLKTVSFKAGVQTNHGISVPPPSGNMVEGNLLIGFFGTVTSLLGLIHKRADSIDKGLDEAKLNYLA